MYSRIVHTRRLWAVGVNHLRSLTDVHPPLQLLTHGHIHGSSQAYTTDMLVIYGLAPGSNFMDVAAPRHPSIQYQTWHAQLASYIVKPAHVTIGINFRSIVRKRMAVNNFPTETFK